MIQVIDFESTGLIDPQPVQYAQVVFSEFASLDIWEFQQVTMLPTKPMEYGAMGVTGITNEFLQDNYDLKYDEVKSGKGWIGEGVEYLVAHNASYDTKFICPEQLAKVKVLCTLKLSRKLIDKSLCGDHKNSTLYYYLGCYKNPKYPERMTKTHSALTDALMTTEILLAMLSKFNLTMEQAYQLSIGNDVQQEEDITVCPFQKYKGIPWKQVVRKDADYCLWLLSSGKIRSKLMADYLDGLLNMKSPD